MSKIFLKKSIVNLAVLGELLASSNAYAKVAQFDFKPIQTVKLFPEHPLFIRGWTEILSGKKNAPKKILEVSPEEALENFYPSLVHYIGKKEAHLKSPYIFSEKFFGMKGSEVFIRSYYKDPHAKDISYDKFLTPKLIRSIYNSAKQILHKTKQGDVLVIFGNSPALVGRALTHLCSNNEKKPDFRRLVFFPFSGAPNAVRNVPHAYSLMTKKRLEHLSQRLGKEGLLPKFGNPSFPTIYFIDAIGAGSGLYCVISKILEYANHLKLPLPKISIISINEIEVGNRNKPRNSWISPRSAKDGEEIMLYFPSIMNVSFSVSGFVSAVEGISILDRLPASTYRLSPEYYPCHWQKRYDFLLDFKPSREATKMLAHFDAYIKRFIGEENGSL